MDPPLPLQALLAFLLPLILIYYCYSCNSKANTKNINHHKTPPEPSGAWPIIGHLPLLSRPGPLCRTLAALADKHGPVFSLRLGARCTVVVSGLAEAKECFTSNDLALAGRPDSAAACIMGYDCAMIGLSPYSPYWREVRKIAMVELLSTARIDALAPVRRAEVDESVKALSARCAEGGGTSSATVEMKRWLGELTFNAVVKMVVGRQCFESARNDDTDVAGRFRKAAADLSMLFGVFEPSDVLPIPKWVDLKGYKAAMRRTAGEMDSLVVSWLEEHRNRQLGGGEVEWDFMDVMLSIIDKAELSMYDPDKIIKAISLGMILGGADTTTISLTWAIALLVNDRRVLRKAQEELDIHVGLDRNVNESDIKSLTYLHAIVKEVMRLYPAGPLLMPHQAIEDCRIGGYHVRAGTQLMVNVWKIQHDPLVWPDPDVFNPERFVGSNVDVRGQHYGLLPFGAGRRSCPGISFALQMMYLVLARLIHGFDMEMSAAAPVDFEEGVGLAIPKAAPLHVVFTPRLAQHLYE